MGDIPIGKLKITIQCQNCKNKIFSDTYDKVEDIYPLPACHRCDAGDWQIVDVADLGT